MAVKMAKKDLILQSSHILASCQCVDREKSQIRPANERQLQLASLPSGQKFNHSEQSPLLPPGQVRQTRKRLRLHFDDRQNSRRIPHQEIDLNARNFAIVIERSPPAGG
jgi:hypothetical protein